jgi:lauroyl/myristoyl acyltransferase
VSRENPTLVETIAWRFEAMAYDLLVGLLRALPVDWASAFGGWLFRTLGPLTPVHRTASDNIRLAFPKLKDREHARLLNAQWDNVGRAFAEFPLMDRIRPETGRVEVVNAERLAEIRDKGEPVVFISGHFANWEVMPATIVESGVTCLMTYRAMNNPLIDQRVKAGRAAYGVELFAPKGEATRDLMAALGKGQSVALMNDQKFNAGLALPFFGHLAHTAPGPSRLALKYDAPLQTMSVQRTKGARYRVIVHEPIRLIQTGDRAKDIETAVRRVNAWVEDRVRERPEEWFWVHKRWPKETYQALRAQEEERDRRFAFRRGLAWVFAGLVILLVAAAFVWREDILRTGLDPKVPFQTYDPPPAPDYAETGAWALRGVETNPAGPADIFFVHPTTYDGGEHWLGPIDEPESADLLARVMLPNYAGPFARVGRIFAPRYRQSSLYTQLTLRDDAREARAFAYRDVRAAFEAYRAQYDRGRPLILAGTGQGAELVARLAEDLIEEDPTFRDRLAVVYVMDAIVPAVSHGPASDLPACLDRDQSGCVVAWAQVREGADDVARRRVERAQVWTERGGLVGLEGRDPLCVNPVLGAATGAIAPARLSLGAANATGLEWGARPPLISRQVETQCVDGVLRHSLPRSPSLRPSGSWADQRKSPPYNLFYADIEADALARVEAWRER